MDGRSYKLVSFKMRSNTLRSLFLCLLLHEAFAFNLQSNNNEVRYMRSKVMQWNGTTSSWTIPEGTEPSFYGYQLNMYASLDNTSSIVIGSPKIIDPAQPILQSIRITPRPDPKGGVQNCAISKNFFDDSTPIPCKPMYPPDPKVGDNAGISMSVRTNGNAVACTPYRNQNCDGVKYSKGVCFKSANFGSSWNALSENRLKCPTLNVDVLFLLDGSGSVGSENFKIVKDWVKNISKKIGIDEGHVQVGVVQYSHYYQNLTSQPYLQTHIKIGAFQTFSSFSSEMDKIVLHGYTTYTGQALKKVQEDFKATKNYGKKTSKQVLILLTDGRASDKDLVPQSAKDLRSIGVIPYAVGVGSKVGVNELRTIANGDPTNDTRVFMANNFEGLEKIAKELEAQIGELKLEGQTSSNNSASQLEYAQEGFSAAFSRVLSRFRRRRAVLNNATVGLAKCKCGGNVYE